MSRPLVTALAVALSSLLADPALTAEVYHVDRASPACSDAGPGTDVLPYCTVTAAVAAHNGPGVTIRVGAGVYREQVTVPSSGAAGAPFVLEAVGGPVTVDGADDLSGASNWVHASGDVFLAAGVTWTPKQVFADGVRLEPSEAAPEDLPPNAFRHVAPYGLYVNLGGGDPGTHRMEVGRRLHGFRLSGRSHVTVRGFDVLHTEDRGIYLTGASMHCVIRENRVRFGYRQGIALSGGAANLIASNIVTDNQDDGISLVAGATGCTIEDNESARNAHPTERRAQGIELSGAPGNLIRRNRLHHNQDTGEHLSAGADDNASIQNIAWSNGDHGFDRLNSSRTLSIGDVAWGNVRDGFSNEGTSVGGRIYDCIAVDNGLATNRFNLWVDGRSALGFESDYNIFWNSTSRPPVKYVATIYPTLAAYQSATGQDAHSLAGDPRFVDPAAGDFHLLAGSPAIDAAHSGVPGWPATDAEGRARLDDPEVEDTGAGPLAYADRGALERVPPGPPGGSAPVVVAPATVAGREGIALVVDVTASDPDGDPIASLTASGLPAGATFTAGADHARGTLSWTPGPGQAGDHVLRFTASNDRSGDAFTTVTVAPATPALNMLLNPSFEVNTVGWSAHLGSTLRRTEGGFHGAWSLRVEGPSSTDTFGVDDAPNGLMRAPAVGTRYRFSARVRSESHGGEARLRVREYAGGLLRGGDYSGAVVLAPEWRQVTVDYVTTAPGSSIDLQILDAPIAPGEVFQVDDVSIVRVDAGPVPDPPASLEEEEEEPGEWQREPLRPWLHPNPVLAAATLSFMTSRAGELGVDVFDLKGRRVRRLVEPAEAPAGIHRVRFDGRDDRRTPLPAGVYFYRVLAAEGVVTGRFLVAR